jgi:hypothetical protein
MTGYTRQSVADIINGAEITAPPLNSEFNQLTSAFNGAAGHSHDGSTGNAPPIALATSVSGYLPAVHGGIGGKNNNTATTTPLVTNDGTEGYAPMSLWENTTTGRIYVCVGNSTGAAIWRELVQVTSGNSIIPAAHDTVDLGSNAVRFQDIFLSGGISASGNVAVGGTLTLTGSTSLQALTAASATVSGTSVLTSVDINSGAIDNTAIGVTTPVAGTFTTLVANTSLVAATADINGGTLDGATIGASAPSTAAFTTLAASGLATLATVDINAGAIDGTVIGATTKAAGGFTTITSTGQATLATVDINGGAIDGAVIGAASAAAITGTTITGSSLVGPLTGSVTGNTAGTHTGAVVGNVTGNLTGNVTAASGTSTFNNVTVNGTLNMDATTAATITNLTDPTNAQDAATKAYVDTSVANLIDSAPGALDTLNELAAALGDDAAFSTTITNSIATKLPLAGGTMSGAIAMGTSKITGLGDPTTNQDAATKKYSDDQDALKLSLTGGTMSGAIAMGNNKITGLGTPTASTDATTKTYVDAILGSATAAATSAANAATSESNAATSETNAGNSASAALASQNAAAASYDLFDDRFLGAKSSAPTLDNDGNALVTGTLYFNSTSNIMYVYSGAGWQAAGSSVNGTSDRQTYTASSGQTVFAATYDTGYIDVYLNGVKLVAGTDFTATNGTSITLASGATINDVIDIVAYGTFVLADHYDSTASDARYVQQTHTGNVDITGTITADGLTVEDADGATIRIQSSDTSVDGGSLGQLEFYSNDASIGGTGVKGKIQVTDVSSYGTAYEMNFFTGYVTGGAHAETKKMSIGSHGDISFYEDTGTTAKFFWDASAESLGIGDSTFAAGKLQVYDSAGNHVWLKGRASDGTSSVSFRNNADNTYNGRIQVADTGGMLFQVAGSTRATIDASGNLLLNTVSSPTTTKAIISADYSASGTTNTGLSITGRSSGNWWNNGIHALGTALAFSTGTTGITGANATNERLRIDASGNVLVGTTSAYGTTGTTINAAGLVYSSADADRAGQFDRTSNDGEIVRFSKAGTTVGSIGTANGDAITIGNSTGNLILWAANVAPASTASGGASDGVVDLGTSARRFKDLYLSGGVVFNVAGGTGTSTSGTLDDYEEGTWTPVVADATTGGNTGGFAAYSPSGSYTKVGRMVYITCLLNQVTTTGMTGGNAFIIRGLPFTVGKTAYGSLATYRLSRDADTVSSVSSVNEASTWCLFPYFVADSAVTDRLTIVSDVISNTSTVSFTIAYQV